MKIFISWSGERSQALAQALRDWFQLALHFVEPWLSKSDIQAGERWNIEVAKELEISNFGVLCITRENLISPWILFEAGALAKSMQEGRVIPVLLDLDFKDISGPLVQFQAKKVDGEGLKELVFSLNKAHSSPIPDAQLEKLFTLVWPDLEKRIAGIPKPSSAKHNRPQPEILEELVTGVRSVEMRIRHLIDDDMSLRRRNRSRIPTKMLFAAMDRIANGSPHPLKILILASAMRDEAPWIYELAQEVNRVAHSVRRDREAAVGRVIEALELMPSEMFSIDPTIVRALRSESMALYEQFCEKRATFVPVKVETTVSSSRSAASELTEE